MSPKLSFVLSLDSEFPHAVFQSTTIKSCEDIVPSRLTRIVRFFTAKPWLTSTTISLLRNPLIVSLIATPWFAQLSQSRLQSVLYSTDQISSFFVLSYSELRMSLWKGPYLWLYVPRIEVLKSGSEPHAFRIVLPISSIIIPQSRTQGFRWESIGFSEVLWAEQSLRYSLNTFATKFSAFSHVPSLILVNPKVSSPFLCLDDPNWSIFGSNYSWSFAK